MLSMPKERGTLGLEAMGRKNNGKSKTKTIIFLSNGIESLHKKELRL